MKAKSTYWFGRKRFGLGFGPRSWQGWLTLLIYAVLMISLPHWIAPASHRVLLIALQITLTVALTVIFFLKLDTSKRH